MELLEALVMLLELIAEIALLLGAERGTSEVIRRSRRQPWLVRKFGEGGAFFLTVVFASALGLVSVALFPRHLFRQEGFRIVALFAVPLAVSLVVSVHARALRKRGRVMVRLDSIPYAFAFSFVVALVRFLACV